MERRNKRAFFFLPRSSLTPPRTTESLLLEGRPQHSQQKKEPKFEKKRFSRKLQRKHQESSCFFSILPTSFILLFGAKRHILSGFISLKDPFQSYKHINKIGKEKEISLSSVHTQTPFYFQSDLLVHRDGACHLAIQNAIKCQDPEKNKSSKTFSFALIRIRLLLRMPKKPNTPGIRLFTIVNYIITIEQHQQFYFQNEFFFGFFLFQRDNTCNKQSYKKILLNFC